MKTLFRSLMAGLGTALFLAACGGGGGGEAATPVASPTAVASASTTLLPIGDTVTLDGGGSTSPRSGATLRYQWELTTRPEGSSADLAGAQTAQASFVPDVDGVYLVTLRVNDGTAEGSASVSITATNPNPQGIIGNPSQSVLQGVTVTLDGSPSLPPTGGNAGDLSYQWVLISEPDGTPTLLRDATRAQASFVAEKAGEYRAQLVVQHGDKLSPPVEALINVNTGNSAPVIAIVQPVGSSINAAGALVMPATLNRPFVLDASGSTDAQGDVLSYRWYFPGNVVRLRGAEAAIVNASSAVAEYTPDIVGNHNLEFMVYDGSVAVTQRIILQVTKAADDTSNTAPVAGMTFASLGTDECELGGTSIYWPYCTAYSYGHDADGDTLTSTWTYWNLATPDNRLTATGSSLALDGSVAGQWHLELVVSDGKVNSAPISKTVTIKIGANALPVASVKIDIAKVLRGDTLHFDGRASSDRNNDEIFYQWTLIDRPNGSAATVQNATSAQASVVTDRPGVYTVLLRVTDSKGAVSAITNTAARATGFAKEQNNPPVIANYALQRKLYNYYTESGGSIRATELLDGGLSSIIAPGQALLLPAFGWQFVRAIDPDQDSPIYHLMNPVTQPAGSSFQAISYAPFDGSNPNLNLHFTVPGDYAFEALVSDGVASSQPARVAFTAIDNHANYPSLLIERTIEPQMGGAVGTAFSQVFFPFVATHETNHSGILDVPAGATAVAVDRFRLTAYDRDYTVTDLRALSGVDGFVPAFDGLVNGQVIRQGQSVEFTLTRPPIANEAALYAAWQAAGGGTSNAGRFEFQRVKPQVDAYQFHWSFRIAEREGFTFQRGAPR